MLISENVQQFSMQFSTNIEIVLDSQRHVEIELLIQLDKELTMKCKLKLNR